MEWHRIRWHYFLSRLPEHGQSFFQSHSGQYFKGTGFDCFSRRNQSQGSLEQKMLLIPVENGLFKTGSTTEWKTIDTSPTAEGRQLIEDNLKLLINNKFEVVDHVAGIRPTVPDRRPLMGEHGILKGYYIFNGLGTKGYMMAPTLSREMCDHILEGAPLHEEVRIQRIKKK